MDEAAIKKEDKQTKVYITKIVISGPASGGHPLLGRRGRVGGWVSEGGVWVAQSGGRRDLCMFVRRSVFTYLYV